MSGKNDGVDALSTAEKIQIFEKTFRGRMDGHGAKDGSCIKENITDGLILKHLQGEERLGMYPLSPGILDGSGTYFVVADIDCGEKKSLKTDGEAQQVAKAIWNTLDGLDISSYIEASKSKGYHVWTFFSEPVPATNARALMSYAIEGDIEIFPKQDRIDVGQYGNYMNLPLFGADVEKGKTAFLDPTNSYKPYPDQWTFLKNIKKVSPETIEGLIADGEISPDKKDTVLTVEAENDYSAMMRGELVNGSRTNTLTRLAGHWYSQNTPIDEAIAQAQAWDTGNDLGLDTDPQYQNQYPSMGKVEGTVRDIYRRNDKKGKVEKIRKGKATKRKQSLSAHIYAELQEAGKFVRTESEYFYFIEDEKKLVSLSSMDFIAMINKKYRLVEGEVDCSYVLSDLKAKCHLYGDHTDIYRFAFYDSKKYLLYIDRFDGSVYRLDGDSIELLSNGAEGVLFQYDPTHEKYEVAAWNEKKGLDAFLIQRINFEVSSLSIEDQRALFSVWLQAIFFESIIQAKPLLLFSGVKASGKTCASRMIGRLLFGSKYNVNSIPAEERDFLAIVSNNYLPTFDNADSKKYWLPDRLALISTGETIQLRKLYTTNEIERYYPRCFLMLTARTPQFKRDDVVDRLFIFRLKSIDNFTPEPLLMQDVEKNRNQMLSELFHKLNTAIKKLKANRSHPYSGGIRMADFADFVWKVADDRNTLISILEKMSDEQSEFLLEDDPFVECLDVWLEFQGNAGKKVTASQLFDELKSVGESDRIAFPYKSSRSLSMKLRHEKKNLQRFFDFELTQRRGYPNQYEFNKKE